MCVVCGCSGSGPAAVPIGSPAPVGAETARADSVDASPSMHGVPGISPARAIRLETDILAENARLAQINRRHFDDHGVIALNLLSSPGSGKTTLLCATIAALRGRRAPPHVAVIEGDQQTSLDADRIRATGAPAIQVNTGRGCHLDAAMVATAFARLHDHEAAHAPAHATELAHLHHQNQNHNHHHLDPAYSGSLLFIENVGNLVCPALWDLGEHAKVVVLSVTEGDDKPLKYPDMFAAASLMLINKIDLLPHVDFDVSRCVAAARRVNPHIEVLQLSATTGTGLDAWIGWLDERLSPAAAAPSQAELLHRIAELEAALAEARRAALADARRAALSAEPQGAAGAAAPAAPAAATVCKLPA